MCGTYTYKITLSLLTDQFKKNILNTFLHETSIFLFVSHFVIPAFTLRQMYTNFVNTLILLIEFMNFVL